MNEEQLNVNAQIMAAKFEIAQNYFSDILNSQLVIFSIIVTVVVAVILGLYFLFQYRFSKKKIESAMRSIKIEIRDEVKKEFEEKNKLLNEKMIKELARHDGDISILGGEIYRTLGQYWNSQKNFSIAFIWWIRAANNYAIGGDEKMIRIALGSAKESVEKIQYAFQLDYDIIGEYQTIMSSIDGIKYKIEKDLLDKVIKEALNKK